MALRISCPHCATPHRLADPYPQPGSEIQCTGCGRALAITYPMGLVDKLRERGARFQGESTATPAPVTPILEPLSAPLAGDEERTIMARGDLHAESPTSPLEDHEDEGALNTGTLNTGTVPSEPLPVRPATKKLPPRKPPPPAKKAKKKGSWLWRIGCLGLITVGAGTATVIGTIWFYSQDLPTLETLETYRPPAVTVVYDNKGQVLGEIYEQRRYVVPIETIPVHVQEAFLAAEDANFYNHHGVDPVGIMRAIGRNAKQGEMAQGASTITQQVARNFLLTSEKKLSRKIKEAILATRIETAFTKERILYLYLNQIYLGSGAYGVEAASRIYFDKNVEELTLAEGALLAGLPQRPSDYSPHHSWDQAKGRQSYVLGQMRDKGFITVPEYDEAMAEDIRIVKTDNPIRKLAPYYTEHVRRHLVDEYGFDRVYNEGLIVHTTCDLDLQVVAQEAVTRNVTDLDNKLGWRGAPETLEGDDAINARLATQETAMRDADQFREDNARRNPMPDHSSLFEGERYEAVVLEVEKKHAIVGIGDNKAIVPLSWTTWGYEPNVKKSWRHRTNSGMTDTIKRGDVVTIEVMTLDSQTEKKLDGYDPAVGLPAVKLYQAPDLQGALLSYDLTSGAVLAMVGGVDIEESEFNRAIQSKRQVGSTMKPLVYAAAIESEKFSVASMLLDAPVTYFDHNEEKIWKPGNFGSDYLGPITMRKALALSRNVCTVRVMEVLKTETVLEFGKRLGIESPMQNDMSMALGSSSLSMTELARAYSVLAPPYGQKVEPYFIESVEDRDGNKLEEHQPIPNEQVVDPAVGGIGTWLLRHVATGGTGARSNSLGTHVAGKTGTTNDYKDTWFVGFSPEVITAVWVGYDTPRSMGYGSTGSYVALPMWIDYMAVAWPKERDYPFPEIPGVTYASIDETTGGVVTSGGRGMPFLPGTVPTGQRIEAGQVSTEDFLTGGF